jgi:predicted O-methyltransferase YrrM
MIDINNLCFGQKIDEELGILYPWYTHGALDVISKMDLSDKTVLEYGGGASTLWWCKKARFVYTVDHNTDWRTTISSLLSEYGVEQKSALKYVSTHEGDQTENRDAYVKPFQDMKPDIVIVDGVHRYECAEYAVKVLEPSILIIDNWQQDYVFMCPSAETLLKDIKKEIYPQLDHADHNGNCWKTLIAYLC